MNLRLVDDDGPGIHFVVPGDVVAMERIGDSDDMASRQGHLLRLAGWIDINSRLTVSSSSTSLCNDTKVRRLVARVRS